MKFLRSAWYAAALPEEVTRAPMRRVFCNEPVVLYRREDGAAVALSDVCTHRYAPLSKGALAGDRIACPYHGLVFGADGRCVHDPHGGRITEAHHVKAYALYERYGIVWIWMGKAEEADTGKLPDFSMFETRFRGIAGYTHVAAHYELLTDNLMDCGAHVDYVHPALRVAKATRATEMRQEGDTVWAHGWWRNAELNDFMRQIWPNATAGGDIYNFVRWDAPSLVYLEAGLKIGEVFDETPPLGGVAHLFTPETDTTSHYIWMTSVKKEVNDPKLEAFLRATGNQAFELEDRPIIEAAQVNMGKETDLLSLHPVSFASDGAALRCRRILARRIAEEEGLSRAAE